MGKIDELIHQYCPDGVGYVKLGDVVSISRGASPRPIQNYLTDEEDGIPWIKIGDVSTNSKYITSTDERITREGAKKSRFLKKGTFILSNSMSFGRPYILGIDGCIHDGWISICDFEASLNSDFLYYLLRSSDVQGYWISKANSGGAVANLNSDIVRSTPIPLPPLPVQEAIVNILDRFAVYAAELQAELQARQQQYNYYRDTLLSFEGRDDVQWKKLGEVCDNLDRKRKPITASNRIAGAIPYYGASGIVDYVKDYIFDGDFLLVSEDGANLLTRTYPIAFSIHGKTWVNNHAHILQFEERATRKYVEYYLNSIDLSLWISAGAQPKLTQDNLNKIPIPVPVLSEQQRIVDILDRFDTLVNDLSQGLPAEIEARQQQYEYYRDQLLTFKRKKA